MKSCSVTMPTSLSSRVTGRQASRSRRMIRPEAKSWLLRHREALTGAALCALGLWWMAGPGGLLQLPAVGLILGGSALLWTAVQWMRFRGVGEGQGVVQVTEGQVAYLAAGFTQTCGHLCRQGKQDSGIFLR